MKGFDVLYLKFKRLKECVGQGGDSISAAFAVSNHDLMVGEVHVFDA